MDPGIVTVNGPKLIQNGCQATAYRTMDTKACPRKLSLSFGGKRRDKIYGKSGQIDLLILYWNGQPLKEGPT